MSTDFIFKRIFSYGMAFLFVFFLVCSTAYFQNAKKEYVALQYFYLVHEDVYTQAGAMNAYQEGGAAYLLRENGKDCLALSVYTNEQSAQAVLSAFSYMDKEVRVIEKRVNELYFKTKKEKELSKLYTNGLQSFDECIHVLEECIFNLDKGLSQEKSGEILKILNRQLQYMGKRYRADFKRLSKACFKISEGLTAACGSVIMANDLRYLLCEMAEQCLLSAKEFSL